MMVVTVYNRRDEYICALYWNEEEARTAYPMHQTHEIGEMEIQGTPPERGEADDEDS
jgi:hypothetical protein